MKKVAIVTGGNRGIGFAACRGLARAGLRVVLTARDEGKGEKAAQSLRGEGHEVVFHRLDVTDPKSVEALARWAEKELGRVDALVNNAGIMIDEGDSLQVPASQVLETFETNVLGPYQLTQALIPLMRRQRYGRVVNLSSGMGQLEDMNGGYPAYRISKTALNAMTRVFAADVAGQNILVNSMCPGWVKTDMGGEGASRSPEQGADTAVWLATLPDGGPTGGFFRDRARIAW